MGLFAFLLIAVVAVVATSAAIWVMDQLAPNHPKYIEALLWVVVVLILIVILVNATGVKDVLIPRVR